MGVEAAIDRRSPERAELVAGAADAMTRASGRPGWPDDRPSGSLPKSGPSR